MERHGRLRRQRVAHRGRGHDRDQPYGGTATHATGSGQTTATNAYGGSATHTYGQGTTATNAYGDTAYHATGSGTDDRDQPLRRQRDALRRVRHDRDRRRTARRPITRPAPTTRRRPRAYYPYHPPTTVNYYGSSCGNCGGWSTRGRRRRGRRGRHGRRRGHRLGQHRRRHVERLHAGVAAGSATTRRGHVERLQRRCRRRAAPARRAPTPPASPPAARPPARVRDGRDLSDAARRLHLAQGPGQRRTTSAATPGSSRPTARTASTTAWCPRPERANAMRTAPPVGGVAEN